MPNACLLLREALHYRVEVFTKGLQAAGWSQTDQRILEMTHVASDIKTVSA